MRPGGPVGPRHRPARRGIGEQDHCQTRPECGQCSGRIGSGLSIADRCSRVAEPNQSNIGSSSRTNQHVHRGQIASLVRQNDFTAGSMVLCCLDRHCPSGQQERIARCRFGSDAPVRLGTFDNRVRSESKARERKSLARLECRKTVTGQTAPMAFCKPVAGVWKRTVARELGRLHEQFGPRSPTLRSLHPRAFPVAEPIGPYGPGLSPRNRAVWSCGF